MASEQSPLPAIPASQPPAPAAPAPTPVPAPPAPPAKPALQARPVLRASQLKKQPAAVSAPKPPAPADEVEEVAKTNVPTHEDKAKSSESAKGVGAKDNTSAVADVAQQEGSDQETSPVQRRKEVLSEAPMNRDTDASTHSKTTPFQLPAAVYSPQLLESVTYDIQYYLDWYRQNQIRKKVGARAKDEPNHADETALVIEAWLAGQPATLEALESLLSYLKHLKLPEVHIILAALPNRSQREAFVKWFRTNTTPQVLVSFVADRNLGGGAVIRTPNHVFDYSWRQQLVAGRDKLAGILKRV